MAEAQEAPQIEVAAPADPAKALEKSLANRPDPKHLQNQNILKPGNPKLQQAAADLQKQKVQKDLKSGLAHRPSHDELEHKGILKHGNLDPKLQQAADDLKRRQVEKSLKDKLEHRPAPEEVEAKLKVAEE